MKLALVLVFAAVMCDLYMGDPLRLRHPDFSGLRQEVRNLGSHLARGEYGQLLNNAPLKR